ncbi:ribonuclease P protein subunit [Candidatus Woesearchaeota archaeon]|nr:ribonuclease P protein subunit [Candidatus Woesearchaeota archaeon]
MPITPKNVVRHELIGLTAEIIRARNQKNISIRGKVVDETYKTLVIKTKDSEKRIFKSQVTLKLTLLSKKKVEVAGKLLVARPWDRIKKKQKRY